MKKSIIFSLAFGNIIEWFNFSCYGLFAIQIADAFFPSNNNHISILYSLLTFASGFVVRPLGGIIFGYFGDKYNKYFAVNASICLMALSSFIIGLLPTYSSIGFIAPILLVLMRLLQGISTGDQFSGILSIIGEGSKSSRTVLTGYSNSIVLLGMFLATLIQYFLVILSKHQYLDSAYIWRIPFIVSFLLFIIYILHFRKTFKDLNIKQSNSSNYISLNNIEFFNFIKIFKYQPFDFFLSMFINLSLGSLYYVFFVYFLTYMQIHLKLSKEFSLIFMNISLFVCAIFFILFGYIATKIASRLKFTACLLLLSIAASFIMIIFNGNSLTIISAYISLLIVYCFIVVCTNSLCGEIFLEEYSMSACSLSYDLGLVFSGFTPVIAELLIKNYKFGFQLFLITVFLFFFINIVLFIRRPIFYKTKNDGINI